MTGSEERDVGRRYRNFIAAVRQTPLSLVGALAILMGFQLLGEFLTVRFGIMFPGPLVGMLLLLATLRLYGSPAKPLSDVADTLVSHLGLFFLPAASAIITLWPKAKHDLMTLALAIIVSTLAASIVTAVAARVLSVTTERKRTRKLAAGPLTATGDPS